VRNQDARTHGTQANATSGLISSSHESSDRLILRLFKTSHVLHVAHMLWKDASPWLLTSIISVGAFGYLRRTNLLLLLLFLCCIALFTGAGMLYLLARKLDRMHADFKRIRVQRRKSPISPSPKRPSGAVKKSEGSGKVKKQARPAKRVSPRA